MEKTLIKPSGSSLNENFNLFNNSTYENNIVKFGGNNEINFNAIFEKIINDYEKNSTNNSTNLFNSTANGNY